MTLGALQVLKREGYTRQVTGTKAPFLKIVVVKGKSSCKKGGKKGMNENDLLSTNNN